MPAVSRRNVNEKKENSRDRRRRLEAALQARQTAKRILVPILLSLLAVLVLLFIYKYGFGEPVQGL